MSRYGRSKARAPRGNVLLLSIAVAFFLAMTIAVFVLGYTRIVGSHHEVVKAVEAAALAAAQAYSEVVIEDPNFGLIGISDSAALGIQTDAQDGFGTPVKSINTLLGTVRLDMIIADQLDDATFRALCQRDYQNVMAAKDTLNTEFLRLTHAGEAGNDRLGNAIEPYQAAFNAYHENEIRMTGETNAMVPGSMMLSLGCIADLPTITDIPQPTSFAALDSSDQDQGRYLAYKNVQYNNSDFVFAAIGRSAALVDHKRFATTIANLPYVIPTIIKCEVDQRFSGSSLTGKDQSRTLHAVAAASPGALEDRHPFPGALLFIFDDGAIPELTDPAKVLFDFQLKNSPADLFQTVSGSDYPAGSLSQFHYPTNNSKHPMMNSVMALGLYDWIRRAGTKANVQSLTGFFSTPFAVATADDVHSFQWRPDGTIDYRVLTGSPDAFLPTSESQWNATSGLAYASNNSKIYDLYVNDYVSKPGRANGGKHAGQPLNLSALGQPTVLSSSGISGINSLHSAKQFAVFPQGPGNGTVRVSYREPNIALAIRFHFRN